MTRGKIIYINNNGKAYSTIEFNGDMYPDGNASEVLERFEEGYFRNYYDYERFVERFNKRHYRYNNELIKKFICKDNVIDVTENWTDYLYIINESSKEYIIKGKENTEILNKQSLGIIRFQTFEKAIHRVIREDAIRNTFDFTKEDFVKIIYRLRDSSDLIDKVDELFRNSRDNVESDFCNAASLQISHESTVVYLLKTIMLDKYDNIDYFIYEMDYGRSYEPGMIVDENDKEIDISTAEKLYDYFIDINSVDIKQKQS